LLNNPILWLLTALVILVACLGKFGGSALAARSSGMSWRDSAAIGTLMNTRGLMELVILNIGRELGVITSAVFAMMVLMAIITTAMTTPALHLIYPKRLLDQQAAAAGARRGFSILIPVASPTSGVSLLRLASLLIGKISAESQLIALHLRRPNDREAYRSGLPEQPAGPDEALAPLLAHAKQHEIAVEPLSQDSRDVAADIARFTRARPIDLVMIGFHRPVFSRAILGGTVHRVLTGADANVAVFVDRGLENLRTILIPFMHGPHDRLALQLARRLARNSRTKLTVLQVAPADRAPKAEELPHAEPLDPL
jgi:nucleotide-binding universal stress UspA family protein